METVNIDGVDCVPVEDVNKEVAKRLDVSDDFDISMLNEQYNRTLDGLEAKKQERESIKKRKELDDYISDKYSKQLKDVESFKSLVHSKNITNDDDIHDLFKKLPKQSKRNVVQRFLA